MEQDLKIKVEALLFSAAKFVELAELAKLLNKPKAQISQAIGELKSDYENRQTSIRIISVSDAYKFSVKEEYLELVQSIMEEADFQKATLNTLAYIAYKQPLLQSDLIKMRGVSCYEHIKELEEKEFISRRKKGRSFLIRLVPKFFEYFDLPEDKLKESMKGFEEMEKSIEKAQQKKKEHEQKTEEETPENNSVEKNETTKDQQYEGIIESQKSEEETQEEQKDTAIADMDVVEPQAEPEEPNPQNENESGQKPE